MIQQLIVVLHVLVAFAIIGLILIQQGKGADMGASFGSGASQTVMGSQGTGGLFLKVTALLSVIFFVTSFTLAVMAKDTFKGEDDYDIPTVEQIDQTPVEKASSEVPTLEVPAAKESNTSDEIPSTNADEQTDNDVPQIQEQTKEVPEK